MDIMRQFACPNYIKYLSTYLLTYLVSPITVYRYNFLFDCTTESGFRPNDDPGLKLSSVNWCLAKQFWFSLDNADLIYKQQCYSTTIVKLVKIGALGSDYEMATDLC